MIPVEEMQEQFDGLFYKAISRILFSPDKNRKRYADALASMFSAMQSSDGTITFHDAYTELQSAIEQSPRLIHSQEDLIASFEGKFIPINQRISVLEIQMRNIAKIEKDIKRLDQRTSHKLDTKSFKDYMKENPTIKSKKIVGICETSKLPISTEETKKESKKTYRGKSYNVIVKCDCGYLIHTNQEIGNQTSCRNCYKTLVIKPENVQKEGD